MNTFGAAILLLTLAWCQTNGDPLLFLPEHMLPPPGITFTMAYDLVMATLRIPSVYTVQAILAQDSKTVIGYRNWFQSEYGATYTVSLKNGTYFQSNVDLNKRECVSGLVQIADCAGWSSVEMLTYNNWCQMRPVDMQIFSQRTLVAHSSMTDLKRPVSVTETTTTANLPLQTMTTIYQFTSKNEQISFPDIKCYF